MKPDQKFKQRRKGDRYDDFSMIPANAEEPIVFFGSQSYVPLFCTLTRDVKTKKTIFYNTEYPPEAPGCYLKEFVGAKRDTNWQYDCANAYLKGQLTSNRPGCFPRTNLHEEPCKPLNTAEYGPPVSKYSTRCRIIGS